MNYIKINVYALFTIVSNLLSIVLEIIASVFYSLAIIFCFLVSIVLIMVLVNGVIPFIIYMISNPGELFQTILLLIIGLFTLIGIICYFFFAILGVIAYFFATVIPLIGAYLGGFFEILAQSVYAYLYLPIYSKMIMIPGYYDFSENKDKNIGSVAKNFFVNINVILNKLISIIVHHSRNFGIILSVITVVGFILALEYDARVHYSTNFIDGILNYSTGIDGRLFLISIVLIIISAAIFSFLLGATVSTSFESYKQFIDENTSFSKNIEIDKEEIFNKRKEKIHLSSNN